MGCGTALLHILLRLKLLAQETVASVYPNAFLLHSEFQALSPMIQLSLMHILRGSSSID
jgi:hypothetical protein